MAYYTPLTFFLFDLNTYQNRDDFLIFFLRILFETLESIKLFYLPQSQMVIFLLKKKPVQNHLCVDLTQWINKIHLNH